VIKKEEVKKDWSGWVAGGSAVLGMLMLGFLDDKEKGVRDINVQVTMC
jgi:hypothetical protein